MIEEPEPRPPVLLLHGIWSTGRRDVQRYGPHLHRAGFEILDAQQRFAFLWETWLKPERDAECAARLVEAIGATRPHLIAHSNGCRIAALAMARGARFDRVLFLGPAWPAHAPYPPDAFRRLVVAHSRFDMQVWIGGLLPRHQFGWLGTLGYRGPADDRIHNLDVTPLPHRGYFYSFRVRYWAEWAIDQLQAP